MGQFDGVNRVFRSELNTQVERNLHVDKSDKDKQREEKDELQKESREDVVELHDQEEGEAEAAKKRKRLAPKPPSGLDISA